MSKTSKVLLAASGIITILGIFRQPPDTMLLIYSVFILVLLFRKKFSALVDKVHLSTELKFLFLMVASGLLVEVLAWMSNYLARQPKPALLHPQLIPDLILGVGVYSGLAVAWLFAFRYWRFSLASVFLVSGIFGIFAEQSGVVFANIVRGFYTDPFTVVFSALYILVVYGSFPGVAYLAVGERLNHPKYRDTPLKYPVIWILQFLMSYPTTAIITILASLMRFIPQARPIWEHPFF